MEREPVRPRLGARAVKGVLTDRERQLLDMLHKRGLDCPPDCQCRGKKEEKK